MNKDIQSHCLNCHISTSHAKKRKHQEVDCSSIEKNNIINLADVMDYIYNNLIEYENLNEDFEGHTHFYFQFFIDSDSIYEEILVDINITEKDKDLYIANLIVNMISSRDEYVYVFHSTYNSKSSKFSTFTYWCNSRNELYKHCKKVDDIAKQCNTEARIDHYNCKGLVTIKIYPDDYLVSVDISYEVLHPQPEKLNVIEEIKTYINTCINQSVSDIYQSIKDQ
ncbi:9890_t:CDS:1 [Cetraspora pellucida]|uniref:9890_t:CDS:1 n=1 Tax=Cetraspora pellucida TaxID=1433469 RepID=A0A9N9NEK7_9GLOM|nr:9890_t:CDS:1 [Cetraspora pellucida]